VKEKTFLSYCWVDKMNIFGITVSDTVTVHHHITTLVAESTRFFCALKTIHAHGLDGNASLVLTPVSKSCLVGYLKADERNRFQSVKKAKLYSYLPAPSAL